MCFSHQNMRDMSHRDTCNVNRFYTLPKLLVHLDKTYVSLDTTLLCNSLMKLDWQWKSIIKQHQICNRIQKKNQIRIKRRNKGQSTKV